jgi:hypothetical protein
MLYYRGTRRKKMLTVRGIYENGEIKLKEKFSSSRKIPVFITFLEDMEEAKDQDGVYHDLDYLAGTWTEEDDDPFSARLNFPGG